jgi:hypothetical protein
MPHIFRFHKGTNNNIYDWKTSDKIKPADVREVMDKTNILTSSAGTSIPSPIARMHLFKTAFEIVAAQVRDNKVDAKGIYAGLVSETLDLLELLYKCGDDEKKFRYHKWVFDNSQQDDKVILNFFGNQHGHELLAESFKQAVGQSPFGNKLEITFIYYREGNNEVLVGGTSPFSFVFTSPNFTRKLKDRGFKSIAGLVTEEILFNADYKQLYERDESFIKYVESLVNTQGLPESFQGFGEYVINIRNQYYKKFSGPLPSLKDIQIKDVQLTAVKINLKQISDGDYQVQINRDSDFRMELIPENTNYKGELRPLFLLDGMEYEGQYISPTNKWSSNIRISELQYPEKFLDEIAKRELPGLDGIVYPFVSSFDFFERCLVKLPGYLLNNEKFLTLVEKQDFALPLKPIFFHFFDVQKIREYLNVESKDDRVIFTLTIPVFGPTKGRRTISYKKTYLKENMEVYNGILGIYPLTRATEKDMLFMNKYTVAAFEKTTTTFSVESILFYKKTGTDLVAAEYEARSKYSISRTQTGYYHLDESFDIIQLKFKKDNAALGCIIVPKFIDAKNGTKEYIYAIDFGTSNTHVEYGQVVSGAITATQPFSIKQEEMQLAMMHKPEERLQNEGAIRYLDYENIPSMASLNVRQLVLRELVPFQVGPQPGASVKFPFRTATYESEQFERNEKNNKLFFHANIGFAIEQDAITEDAGSLRYTTNLKWELEKSISDIRYESRVSIFFRELILMIRTKILLEEDTKKGDIGKLKLALSFPDSMGQTLRGKLAELFTIQKNEVLGEKSQPLSEVSESISPYYQLRFADENIQNDSFCNIDIGGGSTDIVLVDKTPSQTNELSCYCSSFKFAGKQLWGSGHNAFKHEQNGFVAYYKNFIIKNASIVQKQLDKPFSNSSMLTEDLVSLLFSQPEYKFAGIFAQNKEFRVVLIIHYAAILFYISKLCQLYKLALPRTISFSGKGSEYLNLIFPNKNKEDLKGFTKKVLSIFAHGTLQQVRPDFMVQRSDTPKVITAKGSVHFANETIHVSEDDWENAPVESNNTKKKLKLLNVSYKGFSDFSLEPKSITYGDLQEGTNYYDEIMKSLEEFFRLLFDDSDLCKIINSKLEIRDFHQYKKFFIPEAPTENGDDTTEASKLKKLVKQIGHSGKLRDSFLAMAKPDMQHDETVSDSPFFFALSYSLVALTREIAEKQ